MTFENLRRSWDGMLSEQKFLRGIIGVNAVATLMLVGMVISDDPIVILQPLQVTSEARVSVDSADEAYLNFLGHMFAVTLGNTTPENVDQVSTIMEPYLAPAISNEVIVALNKDAISMVENNISQRFNLRNVRYEEKTGKVFAYGNLYRAGSGRKAEKEEYTFEFIFEIVNYMPQISHLDSYSGKPRTLDEIERIERKKEAERKRAER